MNEVPKFTPFMASTVWLGDLLILARHAAPCPKIKGGLDWLRKKATLWPFQLFSSDPLEGEGAATKLQLLLSFTDIRIFSFFSSSRTRLVRDSVATVLLDTKRLLASSVINELLNGQLHSCKHTVLPYSVSPIAQTAALPVADAAVAPAPGAVVEHDQVSKYI